MKKILIRIFVVLVIFGAVGFSVVSTRQVHRLQEEKGAIAGKLEGEQRKFRLLQNKYAEEKARSSILLRSKTAVEGKNRELNRIVEGLQKEKDSMADEVARQKEMCRKSLSDIESKMAVLKIESRQLSDVNQKLKAKVADCAANMAQRNERISSLVENLQNLEAQRQETTQTLRRCATHNSRLVEISEELVEKYKQKKCTASLLQNEPFTGVKKVELEHLMQEYSERIDKARFDNEG
jgi:chromosome segregation ATPase